MPRLSLEQRQVEMRLRLNAEPLPAKKRKSPVLVVRRPRVAKTVLAIQETQPIAVVREPEPEQEPEAMQEFTADASPIIKTLCREKACPFPPGPSGLCRQHQWLCKAEKSPMGSSLSPKSLEGA